MRKDKVDMNQTAAAFSDPEAISSYTEGPPRLVPGYAGMQRMTSVLLAEHVGNSGNVLVLGAGGGLELKVFAESHPTWNFLGVDPSSEMLKLAERVLGPLAAQVTLKNGTIDDAPLGPFDGATCLLTMHFLSVEERRRTAAEIHRRLRPGSPFVVAHFSIPERSRALWLARFAAFAVDSGVEPDKAAKARDGIGERLPILTPEQDEAILRDAGFKDISLFYAGFTFRGWVGYA
jgi:tRNA (cmo5U34)-methyltransferase